MYRYALVRGNGVTAEKVARYLPNNYKVIWEGEHPAFPGDSLGHVVVVGGRDEHGWTLHGYVQPRLGGGLYGCEEVGLDHAVLGHAVMEKIPVEV